MDLVWDPSQIGSEFASWGSKWKKFDEAANLDAIFETLEFGARS